MTSLARATPTFAMLVAIAILPGCYASHGVGSLAEEESGYCAVACTVDADCGPRGECTTEGVCERVACASDADCPPELTCGDSGVGAERDCLSRCEDDSDCTNFGTFGPQRCEDGACVSAGCPSDEWCTGVHRESIGSPTSRWRCEPEPGEVPACRWICDSDAECVSDRYPAPLHCRSGHCVLDPCTSDAECEAWWGSGRQCVSP